MRYIGAIKACESQFLQMVIALGWIRVEKKIVVLPELPQTLLGRLLLLLPPPLLICYSSSSSHPKGASIHDVRKMFGFNPPPSPITFINQLILFLLSAFWSPPTVDVIYGSPLNSISLSRMRLKVVCCPRSAKVGENGSLPGYSPCRALPIIQVSPIVVRVRLPKGDFLQLKLFCTRAMREFHPGVLFYFKKQGENAILQSNVYRVV